MKKYLVTGGSGFIGSALVRALVERGNAVRCFDNHWRGTERNLSDLRNKVEMATGDIRDASAVAKATQGIDVVCHLAAINGTENFYSKPELVLDVSVKGMVNVIDACRKSGVGHLLLMSTSEVYQTPPKIPTDENVPLVIPDPQNPRYSYAAGKIISEMMAIHYRAGFDKIQIVRPHNVYGPSMGHEHVVPQLIKRVLDLSSETRGKIRLPIQGSGEETRAFVYISDMIDGTLAVIDHGKNSEIYHLGTQQEVRISDLAREIGRCFGREIQIIPGEIQKGGTSRRCPDISKARALGYRPKVSLQEGLALTCKSYEDNFVNNRSIAA